MWVVLNDAFLSIVQTAVKDRLLVRARRAQDIRNVFPDARVITTPSRDYQFRTTVTRKAVVAAMGREVNRIDYTNFKDSVAETDRHDIYTRVWREMLALGYRRPLMTYNDPYDGGDPRDAEEI